MREEDAVPIMAGFVVTHVQEVVSVIVAVTELHSQRNVPLITRNVVIRYRLPLLWFVMPTIRIFAPQKQSAQTLALIGAMVPAR